MDFKDYFRISGPPACHSLTVQDDATRYSLRVDGRSSTSTEPMVRSLEQALQGTRPSKSDP